jgi:hypothetical protein
MVFDPASVLAGGASATAVAAISRERLARRAINRQARRQPYWYLREVDRALTDRTRE